MRVSNLTGVGTQMFQATVFGAIGGYAGLKFLKEHMGLSSVLLTNLQEWLGKSGFSPSDSGTP